MPRSVEISRQNGRRILEKMPEVRRAINAAVSAAKTELRAETAPTARIYPTLLGGWANRPDNRALSYFMDPYGNVVFRGAIQGGNTANGTTLFNVVSAYRPQAQVLAGVTVNTQSSERIIVQTNGNVDLFGAATGVTVSFDGTSYNVDVPA